MKKFPNEKVKKRKVFVNNEDLFNELKQISETDAELLFAKNLFPLLNEQAIK